MGDRSRSSIYARIFSSKSFLCLLALILCVLGYWFTTRVVYRRDIAFGPRSAEGIIPRIEMPNSPFDPSNEYIAEVILLDDGNRVIFPTTEIRFNSGNAEDGVKSFAKSMQWSSPGCLEGYIEFSHHIQKIEICKVADNNWEVKKEMRDRD